VAFPDRMYFLFPYFVFRDSFFTLSLLLIITLLAELGSLSFLVLLTLTFVFLSLFSLS